MQRCVGNIDLTFSTASLGLIAIVPLVVVPDGLVWKATAITATGVAVLHWLLLWMIRIRHRFFRDRVVGNIRRVLQDVVNNRLAVINLTLTRHQDVIPREELEHVRNNIDDISLELERLDGATIDEWRAHYTTSAGPAVRRHPERC